ADQTVDYANSVFGKVERRGYLAAVAEWNLSPAIDRDAPRRIGEGQSRFRLNESVFDGLRAVFAFYDHIGFGEAFGDVAIFKMVMLQTIAVSAWRVMRDVVVQDRRIGQRGLFRP